MRSLLGLIKRSIRAAERSGRKSRISETLLFAWRGILRLLPVVFRILSRLLGERLLPLRVPAERPPSLRISTKKLLLSKL